MHGHLQKNTIHYWRDKQGHEIDFVIHNKKTNELTAIECKFTSASLSKSRSNNTALSTNIEAFRRHYPQGKNYIVSSDVDTPFERLYGDTHFHFVNPSDLIKALL